jgi:hypothetical protein
MKGRLVEKVKAGWSCLKMDYKAVVMAETSMLILTSGFILLPKVTVLCRMMLDNFVLELGFMAPIKNWFVWNIWNYAPLFFILWFLSWTIWFMYKAIRIVGGRCWII